MGNHKPSQACELCRFKRRRCDFNRPSCSQCIRARATCHGYRDSFALRLRNETASVARKVQAIKSSDSLLPIKQASAQASSSWLLSRSLSPEDDTSSETAYPVTRHSFIELDGRQGQTFKDSSHGNVMPLPDLSGLLRLQANPSQVAVQGFMNEYVPHSHFDYLPRFYPLLCASDPQIDLALSVPALALLSKHLRQPVIMHHAYERYEKLVQITQKALNQNVTATHDSTLLHILLLALFENIVLQGRQNPSNWNTHIHGSAALLNMRGCQQFQQPFSRQLFRHASHIIRVSCILKRLPVPRLLSELDFPKENNSRLKTDFNFGNLFDDLADLRANKMKWPAEKRLQRYHDLDERVSAVLAMISKIAVLQRVTSPSILTNVSHHLDYGHGVDTYGSLRFAQQMNALRMIRIFLNGAICNSGVTTGNANEEQEAILSGPASVIQLPAAEVTSICEVAMANCEGATKGILRSVPFFVDLQPSFAVNSLIGPLYAVKGSFLASKSATDFAKSVLHYIGEEYGISQAVELAAAPEGCHNLEDWMFMSHFR